MLIRTPFKLAMLNWMFLISIGVQYVRPIIQTILKKKRKRPFNYYAITKLPNSPVSLAYVLLHFWYVVMGIMITNKLDKQNLYCNLLKLKPPKWPNFKNNMKYTNFEHWSKTELYIIAFRLNVMMYKTEERWYYWMVRRTVSVRVFVNLKSVTIYICNNVLSKLSMSVGNYAHSVLTVRFSGKGSIFS